MTKYFKDKDFLFISINAFVLGFTIMGFEMLGSRYLYPFFGSTIEVWSILISTILLALMAGYFLGGYLADKYPNYKSIGSITILSSFLMLLIIASIESILVFISETIDSNLLGVTIGSFLLIFPPILLLGCFTPYSIKLSMHDLDESGKISGILYGVSTIGNILGILITTILLIPLLGVKITTLLMSLTCFLSGFSCHLKNQQENMVRNNSKNQQNQSRNNSLKIINNNRPNKIIEDESDIETEQNSNKNKSSIKKKTKTSLRKGSKLNLGKKKIIAERTKKNYQQREIFDVIEENSSLKGIAIKKFNEIQSKIERISAMRDSKISEGKKSKHKNSDIFKKKID